VATGKLERVIRAPLRLTAAANRFLNILLSFDTRYFATTWYVDELALTFSLTQAPREKRNRAVTRNKHIVCKLKIIRSPLLQTANANGAQRNERLRNRLYNRRYNLCSTIV